MEDELELDTAIDVAGATASRPPAMPAWTPPYPAMIGRYHVLASIGKGGMAEVYAAELRGPQGFRRRVAIKRLHAALADDPDMVARFVREATIAAQLVHPAICQVYELDEDEHGCFIVMEYLDGITLAVTLKELARARWLLPLPVVLRLMRALCAGLHCAHDLKDETGAPLNLIHRDVSPSNIVLTASGQVKLLDFGVAKTDHVRTHVGQVRGKPGYMSPEQVSRQALDRRSDVYSLGIVLYEALTSSRLFSQGRVADPALAAEVHIPDPRAQRPDLPPAAVQVLDRALAHDVDARYPTAAALAAAFAAAVSPTIVAPSRWLASMVGAIRERQGEATSSWTSGPSLIVPGPRTPRTPADVETPTPMGTPT
jgi:serine/threonine-protein kinase